MQQLLARQDAAAPNIDALRRSDILSNFVESIRETDGLAMRTPGLPI